MDKVSLIEKFGKCTELWSPKIVGKLNRQYVKLEKLNGEFMWHHHKNEDELFMVVKGRFVIKLKDRDVVINAGEFYCAARR